MPLVFKKKLAPAAKIAVWKIEEEENFFHERMPLAPDEQSEVASLKGIRRLEWLACRWLLHELTSFDLRLPLAKDAFSKPFFEEKENLVCSLSHSRGVVAAMFCDLDDLPEEQRAGFSCGCDLQIIVGKMEQIAPKFTRSDEFEWLAAHAERRLDLLHFIWTAKESLYKSWGKKELDFRQHLRLSDFRMGRDGRVEAAGLVEKGAERWLFGVFSEKIFIENFGYFVLTWALPNRCRKAS